MISLKQQYLTLCTFESLTEASWQDEAKGVRFPRMRQKITVCDCQRNKYELAAQNLPSTAPMWSADHLQDQQNLAQSACMEYTYHNLCSAFELYLAVLPPKLGECSTVLIQRLNMTPLTLAVNRKFAAYESPEIE